MEILADALDSHESDRQRISELTEYMRLAEKAFRRVIATSKIFHTGSLHSKGKITSLSRQKALQVSWTISPALYQRNKYTIFNFYKVYYSLKSSGKRIVDHKTQFWHGGLVKKFQIKDC